MCFYKILLAKLSELEYKNEYLHLRRLCANYNVVLNFFFFLNNSAFGIADGFNSTFLEHLSWQSFIF